MNPVDRDTVAQLLERARAAGLLDAFSITGDKVHVRAGTVSARMPLQDALTLARALLRHHERAQRAA